MNRYSINFKYLELNSNGRKYIYANSEKEALKIFEELYQDYHVEITGIKLIS